MATGQPVRPRGRTCLQAATIALLLVVALVFPPPRLLLPLPLDIGEVSEVVEDVVLSVSITWSTVVAKKEGGSVV